MNLDLLVNLLGRENVSTAVEDRVVYARDASRLEGECLAVAWPEHAEQVAALVAWAKEQRVDLVPRGAGTGLCGGATPQRSVVVDLSRMTRILEVNPEARQVTVEAGVVLGQLNRHLAPHGLMLPVVPGSHRAASIGGMLATDAAGLRAVRYGTMIRWVESLLLVDGMGGVHHLSGNALQDAVGREGVTGFIVQATLRLAPLPARRSLSLRAFTSLDELLRQRDVWLTHPHLTALEYVNAHAAAAIGWEPAPHLLAEFDAHVGEIRDPARVAALWRARDGLYPVLARRGYPTIEDPQVDGEGLARLLAWLEEEGIPTFGHLGVGIVHPCFPVDDARVPRLYERVAQWGGRVSGEHGIGLKKRAWTDAAFRAAIQELKARYDPAGIINRGKLC